MADTGTAEAENKQIIIDYKWKEIPLNPHWYKSLTESINNSGRRKKYFNTITNNS